MDLKHCVCVFSVLIPTFDKCPPLDLAWAYFKTCCFMTGSQNQFFVTSRAALIGIDAQLPAMSIVLGPESESIGNPHWFTMIKPENKVNLFLVCLRSIEMRNPLRPTNRIHEATDFRLESESQVQAYNSGAAWMQLPT